MSMQPVNLSDELRTEICDWISECNGFHDHPYGEADEELEESARSGLMDKRLVNFIESNFDGGMVEFIKCGLTQSK